METDIRGQQRQTAKPGVKAYKPTAIDLFCGCGGTTEGLKKAGFKVLAAVDSDERAARTYLANHDDTLVLQADIKTIEPEVLAERLHIGVGELDLMAGCPPCQGFSTMRTLNGAKSIDDPRNDLLLEFLRFIKALRPKTVMLENVPALADDPRFTSFCNELGKLGYLGEHRILNAAEFGVPQRRRRLIYLAGKGMQIPFPRKARRLRTVREFIGNLPSPGESSDPVHDLPERRTPHVMEMIQGIPKDGGSRRDLPLEYQLECHKHCDGFKDVYGRMAWDDVAPTLTSGCFNPSKGRFLHPEEDRAITLREAAMLQGFKRKYKFFATDGKSSIALMIGNALPPPFIAAHGKSIKQALINTRKS